MSDPADKPLIIVVGPGKSGTTALFFCLIESAQRHYGATFPHQFEPQDAAALDGFAHPFGVVKMVAERFRRIDPAHLGRFDKRIFLLRDPRDNVISRLVYQTGTHLKKAGGHEREQILNLFAAKERSPESVSVLELFRAASPLLGVDDWAPIARDVAYYPAEIIRETRGEFFFFRYESFIDRRVEALERHLGFPLTFEFSIWPQLRRVKRVEKHGYWRNWFTGADYDYFVAERRSDLALMGYPDEPVTDRIKVIEPSEISGYFVQFTS